jgi:phage tail sheath gpL-like
MPISFSNIPADLKIPLYWVEVDPSMAGLPVLYQPALIVGTMVAPTMGVTTAVIAAPGTGYAVSDTISLHNGVHLHVSTIGAGGAITAVVVDAGGSIPANVPPPANPVAQYSTSGTGTGATFTLTWTANPVSANPGVGQPNVPIAIGTQAQADNLFGVGSEVSRMFKTYFANNFANEVWGLGIPEPPGAAAAHGTITISQQQTEAGTIHIYIAGRHVATNIAASDTPDEVCAAIAEMINDVGDLPVTAVPSASTVVLTCTWKGVNGNDIRVDLNYYGTVGGEATPIGLGISLPPTGFLTGGVGVPIFDDAIANLGEKPFEYVAMPYTDSTSLNSWELEFGFEDVGRWGWRRQLYGHIFSSRRGAYPDLLTFGNTRNSGVTSVMAMEMTAPSGVFDYTAAYVAKAQRALINDPARPLQTLTLNTCKLAPLQDRFDTIELNSLATNGLATQKAGSDNQPMISRETTTYQLNLYGFRDDAYELVTTLATLARLIRNQRHAITSKYPRVKLADDGTRFGPGQAIVTPGIIKGELIAEYADDMWNGLVENITAFKANLLVERDPNNPNRVNVLYGPDLINQLRIFAVLAQFRLQYDRGIDTQILGPNPATIGMTGIIPQTTFALQG